MTRSFQMAVCVSCAVHAVLFASLRLLKPAAKVQGRGEDRHLVLLVPNTEDFVATATAAPATPAVPPSPPALKSDAPLATRLQPRAPESRLMPVEPPQMRPARVKAIEEAKLTAVEPLLPTVLEQPKVEPGPAQVPAEPATNSGAINQTPAQFKSELLSATRPRKPLEPPGTRLSDAAPALVGGQVNFRRAAQPEYPALARRRRQEGTVLLEVVIAPDGKPATVRVKQSSSFPMLDKAAVEAVRQWEFEVATPVDVRAEVPVRFKLVN